MYEGALDLSELILLVGDPFDPQYDTELEALSNAQPERRWPRPSADAVIAEMVGTIVGACAPLAIVLFGSRARGTQRPGSDIDLLVVLDHVRDKRAVAIALRSLLFAAELPKDIIITSPTEIAVEQSDPNSVIARALREGRVLYER